MKSERVLHVFIQYEPRHEKKCFRSFRPGPTQTRLYRQRLETSDIKKYRDCIIHVVKTKALNRYCDFVFAYSKNYLIILYFCNIF